MHKIIPKTMFKKYLNLFAIACMALFAFASCKNSPPKTDDNYAFKPPVVKPLVFTAPKKIHWVKTAFIAPVVKPFDLNKLPDSTVADHDTAEFKPFKHAVEQTNFNFDDLPSKNFDIDKLPAHPLKVRSIVFDKPVEINAGPPHAATANSALFELSEYQGLSGKNVYAVLTDHNGFIWIATVNGLYRYDGEKLLLYFSTTNFYCSGLKEDKYGRIWVAAGYAGIGILDPKTSVLQMIQHASGLSGTNAYGIFIDDKQRVWTEVEGKINIIDPKSNTVKILGKAQGISENVTVFTADPDKNMWITTAGDGIDIIDQKDNKVKYLTKAQGLKSDSTYIVSPDHKGRMWVSEIMRNQIIINVVDSHNGNIKYINELPLDMESTSFFEDNTGTMWVGILPGAALINLDKQLIGTIQVSASKALGSNLVFDICGDKTGNIWLADFQGLFVKKKNNNLVSHIGNDGVSTIYEDTKGLIWIGDNDGVHVFNRKANTYKNISVKQGLGYNNVQTITSIGNKVAICTDKGIDIIDSTAKTIQHIGNKQTNSVVIDKTGAIWLGTSGGIDVFDPKNKTEKHIGIAQGLSDSVVVDLHLDKQNNVWVGNSRIAIDIINPNTGTIKHLNNQEGFTNTGNRIFLHNASDSVWIGTSNGIYIADEKNNTLTSVAKAQGLHGETIISLLQRGNSVYAATTKGINVINVPNGDNNHMPWKITSYGKDYGVNKIVGSFLTDVISKDGLYWWGDNGIDVFDLSNNLKTPKPICYITGFNLMDHPAFFYDQHDLEAPENNTFIGTKDSSFYNDEKKTLAKNDLAKYNTGGEVAGPYNLPAYLVLPHDQNYLQFHYAALNLVKADSSEYRYMLDGVDEKWSSSTSETSTGNYFNLSPGIYTFKVETLGNDGMWSAPATFGFIIASPWWQTWWARVLFVLLFIGLVWAFVQYRSSQLIKANRLLEHKIHVRTEEVLQQKEEIEAQRDHLEAAVKELKLTQTQLIQSEKLASLGELTAGIAHEIQNPLNFINNFSEVNTELIDEMNEEIGKGNLDEVKAIAGNIKENQQKINHHGKRADGIVKNMLQHSRNNSGEKQLTDINTLADEYFRLSYHGLRAKDKSFNADMVTDFAENLPRVNIIPQDVGRVLINLFNNAFYATQQRKKAEGGNFKPTVSVSTALNGNNIEIKVKDNGTGIPDAVKDKILQPFFTTKPTGEGTGLGLSLSHDIIYKGHGGSISINSAEGDGAQFIIILPVS